MTATDVSAIRERVVELVEQAPAAERRRAERRAARMFGLRHRTVHRWVVRGAGVEPAGPDPDPGDRTPLVTVHPSTRLLALVAIFLVGVDQSLTAGATTGLVAVLVLGPAWWSTLHRYVGAHLLLGTAAVSLLVGWLLMQRSSIDHSIQLHDARSTVVLMVTCFGSVGLLLWARTFVPTSLVAASYGGGLLLANVPTVTGGVLNPWKFGLAIPLAVIVLGLCARTSSRALPLLALAVLAGISLMNDSRSYSGFCLLAAVLVLYQYRRSAGQTGWHRLGQAGLLAGVVLSAYTLITSLLVHGYLGEELQLRTRAQIQNSGSLIAGGRPEWSATIQLMKANPLGYGLGVVPNGNDILVGKTGLDPLRIPTIDGYAEHYMFGGQFKLHSVMADLWSHFGPAGIVLGVVIAVLLVNALTRALNGRVATALLIFIVSLALWDLAFGPIYSNLRYITLALGLALYPRGSGPAPDGGPASGAGP